MDSSLLHEGMAQNENSDVEMRPVGQEDMDDVESCAETIPYDIGKFCLSNIVT